MSPQAITKEQFGISRQDKFNLYPIGDVHCGNAGCDESAFLALCKEIEEDPQALWLGVGDYCDFINRSDPRFNPEDLARWLTMQTVDIVKEQRNFFLAAIKPIAHKCVMFLIGNHELSIHKHYERDLYSELVQPIKEWSAAANGSSIEERIAPGFEGWLRLVFYRDAKRRQGARQFVINAHHGFGGGRLAGAKALNMERWLWTHNADIVIMGHTHTAQVIPAAVQELQRNGRVITHRRMGVRIGSFLGRSESIAPYDVVKGYLPQAQHQPRIVLWPGAEDHKRRIKVIL